MQNIIFQTILLIVLGGLCLTASATVIDSFQTPQNPADESVINANETITGNRLFALDGPSANGTLGGGRLQCQLRSSGDEDSICSTIYNAETGSVDLTENGQNAGIRVVISNLTSDMDIGLQLTDENNVTSGTLSTLSSGENRILFSEFFGLTGTPDYSRIKGILVVFSPTDADTNAAVTVELIATLTGNGSDGGDGGDGGTDITLSSQYSGTFFDPLRNGEGAQFIVLPDNETIVITWYTYLAGKQVWLIGSGNMTQTPATVELTITDGTGFGSDFDPTAVNSAIWGNLTINLPDCNTLTLQANPLLADYEDISLEMTRIIPADCSTINQPAPVNQTGIQFENSGTYYNPNRDGEGMQVSLEPDSQTVIATWYTYLNNDQVWMIGNGQATQGQVMIDAVITQGADFGSRFNASDVVVNNWGIWQINFIDCNTIELVASPTLPDYEPITIEMTKIVPGICS